MPIIKFTKEHHHTYPCRLVVYPAGYEGDVPQEVADLAVLAERAELIKGELTPVDPAEKIEGDGADEPDTDPTPPKTGRAR